MLEGARADDAKSAYLGASRVCTKRFRAAVTAVSFRLIAEGRIRQPNGWCQWEQSSQAVTQPSGALVGIGSSARRPCFVNSGGVLTEVPKGQVYCIGQFGKHLRFPVS